ncbi:MAG: hypothetical protein Unbinned338contig1000_10 [Prokaryotic dsDNA virus sp.]|nr:MAG: hypothetical protein Unbinned338contig1000_10 [Prokaryotic dsDNA virus sp.]|tara:strand:- start:2953 stop:3318 length:366 start_codon:yes stop_codon:yes gene_type:complete
MTDTDKNALQRFSPYAVDGGCDAYGQMEEDDHGDYYNREDVDAAIIALRAENDGLRLNHAGAMSVASDMARDNAALRKRVESADAMVAVLDVVADGDSKDYTDNHIIAGKALAAYRATGDA